MEIDEGEGRFVVDGGVDASLEQRHAERTDRGQDSGVRHARGLDGLGDSGFDLRLEVAKAVTTDMDDNDNGASDNN